MKFPHTRLRRLRQAPWIRELVAETQVSACDLIQPIFLADGKNISQPIPYMPGVYRFSLDKAIEEIHKLHYKGIKLVAIFPVVDAYLKDENGSYAYDKDNFMAKAIEHIKRAVPHIGIMADVALDPYTTHGHDGVLNGDGAVDNDKTIKALIKQSCLLAESGCDVIAPSDMMDGRIHSIRTELEKRGFFDVLIFSYAAKYASSFYSPFRTAVASTIKTGIDKSGYQMDIRNSQEAVLECLLDVEEGADAIIIKPALLYLDIIYRVSNVIQCPIIGYQVSGEYAMINSAAENGIIDYHTGMLESLIAIKRAGARGIITYGASLIADKL